MAPRPDPAFRSYRLTLGAIVFGLTALAVTWLASSVGVALFVHPKLPATARFSGRADDVQAMLACDDDVRVLLDDLAVRRSPPSGAVDEKGDWQAVDEAWQRRWEEVGARCRFEELRDKGLGQAFDHVAWAHAELPEVHRAYVALLKSYYARQQSRIEELRQALESSRRTLERERTAPSAHAG